MPPLQPSRHKSQLRNPTSLLPNKAIVDRLAAKARKPSYGHHACTRRTNHCRWCISTVPRLALTLLVRRPLSAVHRRSRAGTRVCAARLDYAAALLYLYNCREVQFRLRQTRAAGAAVPGSRRACTGGCGRRAPDVALVFCALAGVRQAGPATTTMRSYLPRPMNAEKGQHARSSLYAADRPKEAVLIRFVQAVRRRTVLPASELLNMQSITGVVADLSWTKEEPTLQGFRFLCHA